ncbi:MAG: FAD-dependent oxidoreductase [Rhodospirillales bacterium]|nr:FAD-dependent oxidoreductase [Rhodospirillales bacterium]
MTFSIAGAGVAGLCVAYELARRGHPVTVYERTEALGAESCSRYAGGMLAPWCERASAAAPVLDLGRMAIDWWAAVTTVTRQGTLVVAAAAVPGELAQFAGRTSGFETATVAALEPELAERFPQGLLFAGEAHLDPRRALVDLAAKCRALGVVFHFGAAAPAAVDIDCTGMAAAGRLTDLRPVRGEMLILRGPDIHLARPVRLLDPEWPVYVVPRGNGVYMVGATMVESDNPGPVTVGAVRGLLGSACALHPGFAVAEILETGAGLRPTFPDQLPRVQQTGDTWYINGLFRHGFLLAPAMAMRLAEQICIGRKPQSAD